jgi:hypothetical protein
MLVDLEIQVCTSIQMHYCYCQIITLLVFFSDKLFLSFVLSTFALTIWPWTQVWIKVHSVWDNTGCSKGENSICGLTVSLSHNSVGKFTSNDH